MMIKRRSFGLTKKALVIFLLFIILPTLGVGVIVQYRFTLVLRDQFVQATRLNLDTVTNQLEEQTEMVEDIADYLILNPDMRDFLRINSPLSGDLLDNSKQNIEDFLTFQLMSKSYIKSITISGLNGNSIQMGEPVRGNEQPWLDKADLRKGGIVWSEGYPIYSDWSGNIRLISLFRVLNSYNEITVPQGRLVIRLDESSVSRLLESGTVKENGSVFVIGPEGESILQTGSPLPDGLRPDGELLDRLKSEGDGYVRYKVKQSSYLTFYHQMKNTGWSVVAMIPQSALDKELSGVKRTMNLVLCSILLLGLSALYGFHYTIIRPILRLKKETNRVKLGDFSARVPIESNDEISELNSQFNEMVATIEELIEHKYKLELREREAELKLLQNQMDPHFLYNTLDMIRWTARLEKAEQSSQLIEMLSKFFRSSLNSGSYVTTIRQELEFVRSYLYLQQRRLGKKLVYTLHTEAAIAEAVTLKATIQPLVENFLKHGLDREKKVSVISVRCYANEGDIWIDVKDNGKGFPPGQVEVLNFSLRHMSAGSGGRMGAIHNIHERLSIYFGEGYGLEMMQPDEEGAWIRLKIPCTGNGGGLEHEEQPRGRETDDPDADRG
ncbi:sensor histidine kinase [Paenibacillus sp. P96]|uniref:Sensor histidine kinase n=1 Tax=Paenibacillus zeirhizosphaerae TaxID=2987519 RepID=A0ABT9FU22_9BACL|nr:sensor histidine kinase [Paenibacillus sp. P96]MDP4098238.1 sensor histidine kinase [Paenibacillus sp. P96]